MVSQFCTRCKGPAVLFQRYSGRYLCREHLAVDVVVRAKRTIRAQGGIGRAECIAVLDDSDACPALLHLLSGIIGTRPGIEILVLKEGLDERKGPDPGELSLPVNVRSIVCGEGDIELILKESGIDRVFSSRYLEEHAEAVLNSLLSGSCSDLIGPKGLQYLVLSPFREIPLLEIQEYSASFSLPLINLSTHGSGDGIADMLSSLTKNHPSVPFSLIRYLDRLLTVPNPSGT